MVLEGRLQGEVRWTPRYHKVNNTLLESKEGRERVEAALASNVPWLGVVARIQKEMRQLGKEWAKARRLEEDQLKKEIVRLE
eukprot:c44789_g1_i1 orf=1-243(-)